MAILREIKSFTFPQQDANRPLWVTTSISLLKSHTEATQALTGQIAKRVNAILHVPGNYQGGNLEMAIVIDTTLKPEDFQDAVVLMAMLMTGAIFAEDVCSPCKKRYEELFGYLKNFRQEARSFWYLRTDRMRSWMRRRLRRTFLLF